MYFIRTPKFANLLFPDVLWKVKGVEKEIYLTFDDGPDPEVTPWLLDELDKYKAKASFFVMGDQAQKAPDLLKEVATRGHSIGNHSYSHFDAFKVSADAFLEDVRRGRQVISDIIQKPVPLFRPPYGRLTRKIYREIRSDSQIVMWSLMPGDFDANKSKETVLQNCSQHSKPGSIVVLHDSQKAKDHLKFVLPAFLEMLSAGGYEMKAL